MPSPRPLRSGIDYQLRYGVWRLVRLAIGEDPSCPDAHRLRIEWPLRDDNGGEVWSDFVIEDTNGEVLEVVECREHVEAIPLESLQKFLESVKRIRAGNDTNGRTRFRYVSPVWFSENGKNLKDAAARRALIEGIDPSLIDVMDCVQWDFHAETKSAFASNACLLMHQRVADMKWMYDRLYGRLAAQLSDRMPGAEAACRDAFRDVQIELFVRQPDHHTGRLPPPEDAFDIHDLSKRLNPPTQPFGGLEDDLRRALRDGLFTDDGVSTEDVFVDLDARFECTDIKGAPVTRRTTVMTALVDWLTDVRDFRELPEPLIVVGPFGAGKSTALRAFAARLLDERRDIVPIHLALRNLAYAPDPDTFDDEIRNSVRSRWGFDIDEVSQKTPVCLLLDGFDELNLYYSSGDADAKWAKRVYARFRALARARNLAVVVSSRPLQLLDTEAQVSGRGDRVARLSIEDLRPEQIALWCTAYAKKAGFSEEFSLRYLEERNLTAVARTPIILYMIARIYAKSPEMLPKEKYTLGAIYERFVDWTVRGGYTSEKEKHLVPSTYREVLKDIAWYLAQAEGGMMRERDLLRRLQETHGSMIEDVPVGRNLLVAHMLQPVVRGGTMPEKDHLIEFTHQSFRDYLVAERVVRELHANRIASLAGHPVTAATVEFLFDWIDGMNEEGKKEFLERTQKLDDVETVMPVLAEALLAAATSPALAAGEARRMLDALPTTAAIVASLLLMLRNRAAAGLRDEEQRLAVKDVQYSISSIGLGKLNELLTMFDAQAAYELLVSHLDGLSFGPAASMSGFSAIMPSLRGMAWRKLTANQLWIWAGEAHDCVFREVNFVRAEIMAGHMTNVIFDECSLSQSELAFGTEATPAQIVISRCDLSQSRILHLYVTGSSFTKNIWTGTTVGDGLLLRCTLDAEALLFFRNGGGVRMVNCRRERPAGRWRSNPLWRRYFETLTALPPAEFGPAAEPLVLTAVPGLTNRRVSDRWSVEIGTAESRVLLYVNQLEESILRSVAAIPADTRRYVLVTDDDQKLDELIHKVLAEKFVEAYVWTIADLIDEAFFNVVDAVEAWLYRHAATVKASERPIRYSRGRIEPMDPDMGHETWAEVAADPLTEFDRENRSRIVVITGALQSGKTALARRVVHSAPGRWAFIAGRDHREKMTRLDSLLFSDTDVLALDLAEPWKTVYLEILAAITADMVSDPAFGFIIDRLDDTPDPIALLRLFRETKVSLVITMQTADWHELREKIDAELSTWRDGLGQPYLVLELQR